MSQNSHVLDCPCDDCEGYIVKNEESCLESQYFTKEQGEHVRQESIRSLMLDGMSREEAEALETRRFQRAMSKLFR